MNPNRYDDTDDDPTDDVTDDELAGDRRDLLRYLKETGRVD
jgi:hypothetical protein